jgi:hypothetical protein
MWFGDDDDDGYFENADFERRLRRETQFEYSEEYKEVEFKEVYEEVIRKVYEEVIRETCPYVRVQLTYIPTSGIQCKFVLNRVKRARSPN